MPPLLGTIFCSFLIFSRLLAATSESVQENPIVLGSGPSMNGSSTNHFVVGLTGQPNRVDSSSLSRWGDEVYFLGFADYGDFENVSLGRRVITLEELLRSAPASLLVDRRLNRTGPLSILGASLDPSKNGAGVLALAFGTERSGEPNGVAFVWVSLADLDGPFEALRVSPLVIDLGGTQLKKVVLRQTPDGGGFIAALIPQDPADRVTLLQVKKEEGSSSLRIDYSALLGAGSGILDILPLKDSLQIAAETDSMLFFYNSSRKDKVVGPIDVKSPNSMEPPYDKFSLRTDREQLEIEVYHSGRLIRRRIGVKTRGNPRVPYVRQVSRISPTTLAVSETDLSGNWGRLVVYPTNGFPCRVMKIIADIATP
jgi:hypothetical protein